MATNNKAALSRLGRRRSRGKLVEHGCFPSAILASIPTLSAGIEAEPQFVVNVLIPFLGLGFHASVSVFSCEQVSN